MPQPTVQQLAERLCRATDGISIALADGTEPTDGYMVSLHGYELRVGPHLNWLSALIAAWLKAAGTVKSRHHGIFVGRWTDKNGSVYLDLSIRCTMLVAAYRQAEAHKQTGIYDVAGKRTFYAPIQWPDGSVGWPVSYQKGDCVYNANGESYVP